MASITPQGSDRDNSSDFIGECAIRQSCEPCMKTNISKTASFFCKDCSEFLCNACKNPHTVYKAGKHDIVNYPDTKSEPVIIDMKGMDTCNEHGREIEFFCQDHSKLCCSSCVLVHRKCDQVDEITKVSGQKGPELQALIQSLIQLQSEADAIIADCKLSETGLNESIEKISSEVDKMKDRIIQLFEEAKQKLITEAKDFKTAELRRIANTSETSSKVKEKINEVLPICCNVLERGTPSQQFIYSEILKEKQTTLETNISDQRKIAFATVTASFARELTSLLEMGSNFIKLKYDGNNTDYEDDDEDKEEEEKEEREEDDEEEEDDDDDDADSNPAETSPIILLSQPGAVTLELLVSVNLPKTGDDENEPRLTGLDFLPDGKLIAVDQLNKKCILLNERLQTLGTPYKFTYYPQSVVCVSHDAVCVTFGAVKVCLLSVSTDNTITLTREIKTSSKFDSICCMSPSHMVGSTFDDPCPARMLSVDGVESDFDNVVFPKKTYTYGESNCTYVPSKNTLVLTDNYASTVFMYDTVKGTSRAVTNQNIWLPRGACVGPGDTVLVCSTGKNSIVHLSVDGDILGTYPLDMLRPCNICVSKDGTRLAVSNYANGAKKLQLYKISPAPS